MSRPLRAAMVGLVLASLGFVHITDAARWSWLGPLVALTLLSPLLVRFTRWFAYRAAWNLGVVAVFALLVRSYLESGVHRLLEHGLLLAAFCQVHLVNNLGGKQKPDLLFFNSFLIAVVTSYLSVELAYLVVFLLFAPVFVYGLQLLALDRAGVVPSGAFLWRNARAAAVRTAVVLAATFAVFLLCPRDFHRKGLLGDRLRFSPPRGMSEVDFGDEVTLDRSAGARLSDRVKLTVTIERGERSGVPVYWRGATLDWFDGRQWRRARNLPALGPVDGWRRAGAGEFVRERGQFAATVSVELDETDPEVVFLPLGARQVRLIPPAHRLKTVPVADRTIRCSWGGLEPRRIRYLVEIDRPARRHGGSIATMMRVPVLVYLKPGTLPASARELALALRAGLSPRAPQHKVVEAMRTHLARSRPYLLPGEDGGARDLAEFFDGGRGGHCEVFATALALMLRSQGIPCRLVTGYRSDEWDEPGRRLVLRARHAHAWVEVLDPLAGWYTVDPTPAAEREAAASEPGPFAWLQRAASGLWTRIASFNEGARLRLFAWMAALPGRAADFVRARPIAGLAGILFFALAVAAWLRKRVRARLVPEIAVYLRCLRSLRVRRGAGETPRRLLDRLRAAGAFDPGRLAMLEAATRAHEQARFRAGARIPISREPR